MMIFLWCLVLLSAGLVVNNRYQYRILTAETAKAQKHTNILSEQKQALEYQYNLYTNPKYIAEQAQKLQLLEPVVDKTIYVNIKP